MHRRPRLLFVARDVVLRQQVSAGLESHGFEVLTTDSKDAVPDLFSLLGPFDALVLEEEAPGGPWEPSDDGADLEHLIEQGTTLSAVKGLLERVRAVGQQFQVLLLTGNLRCDEAERAWLGVAAVVRKPFLIDDLAKTVRHALGSH